MTKTELKKVYDLNLKHYEKVCSTSKVIADRVLKEKKIDLFHISFRVKSFESFYEKILRKKYQNPFDDVEDLCGLRIVCVYSNDLEKVNKIIEDTFLIKDFIPKSDLQDFDRFGYRSNHYIVHLPESEEYSQLSNYKIEVQSRTILMHAWAHIQGKLEYKKAEHIPKEFRRKLYQLSAILELADDQFQSLKLEKDRLRALLSADDFRYTAETELNIDTFMSFMDARFPDRKKRYRYSKLLMKEFLKYNIGFDRIIESFEIVHKHIPGFEEEIGLKLTQDEAMKIVLCLANKSNVTFLSKDPLIKDHQKAVKKWCGLVGN